MRLTSKSAPAVAKNATPRHSVRIELTTPQILCDALPTEPRRSVWRQVYSWYYHHSLKQVMAVGRVLCAFRLLTCFYLVVFNLNGDITRKCSSLQYRPGIVLSVCRSARLRSPVVKQSKHGTTIVALPFNTAVAMPAYFALCCDVHPNPGPTLLQHCPGSSTIVCYTRKELLQIGTLPFSTSKFMPLPPLALEWFLMITCHLRSISNKFADPHSFT